VFPKAIKPLRFAEIDQEDWESYRVRLGSPTDRAILQFYRQVVFDHFSHFNEDFPDFFIEHHQFEMTQMTVQEVDKKVRYFGDEELGTFWGEQYDLFETKN